MASKITNAQIYREVGEQKVLLEAIHEQTKKTNGRVTGLEEWRDKQEKKQSFEAGERTQRLITKQNVVTAVSLLIAALALYFR